MSFAGEHKDVAGLHFRGITGVLMDDGQVQHLPLFLQVPLLNLAHSLGLPSSITIFILLQILALPMGLLHRHIRGSFSRHLYSVVVGIVFLWLVFGWTSLFLIGLSAGVYVLVPILPKGRAHAVVFTLSMGYLAIGHLYFMMMHFAVWSMDISAPLMVAVVKLITFAINWDDGLRLRHKEALHKKEMLHKFYSQHALDRYPTPLQFASYIVFYGGVLSGPVFGLREYLSFQSEDLFRKAGLRSCPSPLRPMAQTLLYAVLCYGGVFVSGYFPLEDYVDTEEFLQHPSFLFRIFYLVIGTALFRSKYYFTWYLSEAGCIASGFGFRGQDNTTPGKYRWDAMNNVRVLNIEFGTHVADLTDSWNRRVSDFFKYYVYFRVEAPKFVTSIFGGPRTFAMLATRVTSAFWHGFYFPYYFFFVSVMFLNEVSNVFRHRVEPVLKSMKPSIFKAIFSAFYLLVAKCLTFMCMNYFGVAFAILWTGRALQVWRSVYFFGHVVCATVVVFFKLLPGPEKHPRKLLTKKSD